jgi:excisionase family DNA binding protein
MIRNVNRTKKEAARILGIGTITLDRHRRKGNITYRKIGARVIFTQDDIDTFLERCRIPARIKEVQNEN